MLFQKQIKAIDSQIRDLEQKRQRLLQATDILRVLKELVGSVKSDPGAIASLETEVMRVFPLRGQAYELCEPWDFDWDLEDPVEGEPLAWDFASPLACLLSDKSLFVDRTGTGNRRVYIELVQVEDAPIYYQRKFNGEIVCSYIGFSSKEVALSWLDFLKSLGQAELRQAKRLKEQGYEYEVKIRGVSKSQLERIKNNDFKYPPSPAYLGWQTGDQVVRSSTPFDTWELLESSSSGDVVKAINLRTSQVEDLPLLDCQLVKKFECQEVVVGDGIYHPGQFCQVLYSDRHPNSQGKIGVIEYLSSIYPEFPLTLVIDGELQYFKPEELMIVSGRELAEVYDGEVLEFF
ncbi:hypothetical protein [Coleofasciculus sp.]|uniref:hypothetical protein n=1 Tax=Coleofasciculus sp. TaxID=3100458 RepID=UPI0039F98F96